MSNCSRKQLAIALATQLALDQVPDGIVIPKERVKPWGTVQVIFCAKNVVGEDNFIVINADDFYGREAYSIVVQTLFRTQNILDEFCMAGYLMKNTLLDNGSVSRGVCSVD